MSVVILIKSLNNQAILNIENSLTSDQIILKKIDSNSIVVKSSNLDKLNNLLAPFENNDEIKIIRDNNNNIYKPYERHNLKTLLSPNASTRSWFKANEIAKIYNFPTPDLNKKTIIGVVSFGGGLHGNVDANGVLTNGDVQTYWASLGIAPSNMPKVVIVGINGAVNNPVNDLNSTIENTIDVEQIGACFPSSNLTIYFYLSPNTNDGFVNVFNYIVNNTIAGVNKPNVVSISWGIPEVYADYMTIIDNLFIKAISQGINICAASGDYGSSDGVPGTLTVDFPSSSPNVIACGGTTLICPNLTYDSSTSERTWSGSGGGFSKKFASPSYQSELNKPYRAVPDVALNADPNTGVLYYVNGENMIVGGTSIVAPAIAAYIAALNVNYFVNNKLYLANYSTCFNDIKSGNNGYYNAGINYDQCTGLGSIIGNTLKRILTAQNIPVTDIILNKTSTTINQGQTFQITTNIVPSNSTNTNIIWSSSNINIAKVSNGLITGVLGGSAIITAKLDTVTKNITVTIISPVPKITSIKFNVNNLLVASNQSFYINPIILPSLKSSANLLWSSSNTNIATVNSNGLIISKSPGNVNITVTPVNSNLYAIIKITVIQSRNISKNLSMKDWFLIRK